MNQQTQTISFEVKTEEQPDYCLQEQQEQPLRVLSLQELMLVAGGPTIENQPK